MAPANQEGYLIFSAASSSETAPQKLALGRLDFNIGLCAVLVRLWLFMFDPVCPAALSLPLPFLPVFFAEAASCIGASTCASTWAST